MNKVKTQGEERLVSRKLGTGMMKCNLTKVTHIRHCLPWSTVSQNIVSSVKLP